MSRRVVRQPYQDAWYTGVLTGRHEEGHAILNARGINVGDGCISNDSNWESEEHYYASQTETIGDDGNDD